MEVLIAVDDRVVARFTMTQTHQGEYMGMAGSGKPITIELIEIDRIEKGLIDRFVGYGPLTTSIVLSIPIIRRIMMPEVTSAGKKQETAP